jgi:hypothetical protein
MIWSASRAVDEVVVDAVGDFGAEIERVHEAVVHAAARGVVPEDAVAVGGDEQRNGDVGVFLRQIDGFAAIVPHAGLVLAEAVEAFMRAVDAEDDLGVVGLLAVYLGWMERPVAVGGEHFAAHGSAG